MSLGVPTRVGRQLGLAADAAQRGKEELAQHGKLRHVFAGGARRTVGLGQVQPALDRGGDLAQAAAKVAPLQPPHRLDASRIGRAAAGQLDDQIVAQECAAAG